MAAVGICSGHQKAAGASATYALTVIRVSRCWCGAFSQSSRVRVWRADDPLLHVEWRLSPVAAIRRTALDPRSSTLVRRSALAS